jgi:hypothetical protein
VGLRGRARIRAGVLASARRGVADDEADLGLQEAQQRSMECVRVQWELWGAVARRDQSHALGFPLNPAPYTGILAGRGPFMRSSRPPRGGCPGYPVGCRPLDPAALKGRHEDQRGALEWADVRAPSGRAKAKRWSLRARTGRNSHCTPIPAAQIVLSTRPLDAKLRDGSRGAPVNRGPGESSRGRRVAPQSVGYTNCSQARI